MSRSMLALLMPLAALVACKSPEVRMGGRYVAYLDQAPEPVKDIDVLFVIDDSGSMLEEQEELAYHVQESFLQVLAQGLGEQPNLHVGVVSTTVAAGGHNITGCQSWVGGGEMRVTAPGSTDCGVLDGKFLRDVELPGGVRDTNFSGTLAGSLACMVRLGKGGCGFEQPFAAIERALDGSVPVNAGFLREEALLAVVILTDEDDCSAFDPAMYDPTQTELDGPLGPLKSYRCFEFGVTCADGPAAREPGLRHDCVPREDSPYMIGVQHLAGFLADLKGDPTKVMIIGISGGVEPIEVWLDGMQRPELAPTCPACDNGGPCPEPQPEADAGAPDAAIPDAGPPADADPTPDATPEPPPPTPPVAYPAVRVNALVDAFPARSARGDLCHTPIEATLRRGAEQIATVAARRPCLAGEPRDLDPAAAGVQADCRAFFVKAPQTPDEKRLPVAACERAEPGQPCFSIVVDDATCGPLGGLSARLERGAAPPAQHFVVECLAP